jgi:hypothetical protein
MESADVIRTTLAAAEPLAQSVLEDADGGGAPFRPATTERATTLIDVEPRRLRLQVRGRLGGIARPDGSAERSRPGGRAYTSTAFSCGTTAGATVRPIDLTSVQSELVVAGQPVASRAEPLAGIAASPSLSEASVSRCAPRSRAARREVQRALDRSAHEAAHLVGVPCTAKVVETCSTLPLYERWACRAERRRCSIRWVVPRDERLVRLADAELQDGRQRSRSALDPHRQRDPWSPRTPDTRVLVPVLPLAAATAAHYYRLPGVLTLGGSELAL